MTLLSHITAPDSIVLVAMFSLGMLTGVAVSWIGGNLWMKRRR